MSLTFNPVKSKVLDFDVNIIGTQPTDMSFTFKILGEKVDYGFAGKLIGQTKVRVKVPPLAEVFGEGIFKSKYKAQLDVVGGGYFRNPWKGDILIKRFEIEASLSQGKPDAVKDDNVDDSFNVNAFVNDLENESGVEESSGDTAESDVKIDNIKKTSEDNTSAKILSYYN